MLKGLLLFCIFLTVNSQFWDFQGNKTAVFNGINSLVNLDIPINFKCYETPYTAEYYHSSFKAFGVEITQIFNLLSDQTSAMIPNFRSLSVTLDQFQNILSIPNTTSDTFIQIGMRTLLFIPPVRNLVILLHSFLMKY
jgi:hypothetical protein